MNKPLKQHLIDPEICIRCYTCEATCPIEAISHDDNNVVVDPAICNFCMDCIPVCPTGSIDEWRVVSTPYTTDEQYEWMELPVQQTFGDSASDAETAIEAFDDAIAAMLAEAHSGAGGKVVAPASAAKPAVNLYTLGKPATATVQGNYRLTGKGSDNDVRHVILDLGAQPFPVLEGQSIGVIAPGTDADGRAHQPRLYSVSSPRDGERPNYNNLSLTIKREERGICSNYLCDLAAGDTLTLIGPFGASFLLPNDRNARLLMICTGTGSAPFRAFTMQRQRTGATAAGGMSLFFGARTADSLPYFGPLNKIDDTVLRKFLVFSREAGAKQYVQDVLLEQRDLLVELLQDSDTYVYICGLRAMEAGVDETFRLVAEGMGESWTSLRDSLRRDGRYHVETY